MDPFSTSFLVWGLSCGILALSEGTLDVEPKLTPKMHLFMIHFQRVKSCESVVNSVQIAFLRVPKKSIDLGSILTPILDPYWHQKCSLYSKRTTLAPKSSIRKWSWKNSHSWQVLAGGGRGVGPLRRRGVAHVLRVIFKANPFKIELEAGAVCSICDSCLSEARGFELLTGFVSYV